MFIAILYKKFSIDYKKLKKENIFDFHSSLEVQISPRSFSCFII